MFSILVESGMEREKERKKNFKDVLLLFLACKGQLIVRTLIRKRWNPWFWHTLAHGQTKNSCQTEQKNFIISIQNQVFILPHLVHSNSVYFWKMPQNPTNFSRFKGVQKGQEDSLSHFSYSTSSSTAWTCYEHLLWVMHNKKQQRGDQKDATASLALNTLSRHFLANKQVH